MACGRESENALSTSPSEERWRFDSPAALHADDAHSWAMMRSWQPGFLFAEGFINSATELGEIRRVRGRKGGIGANAIDIVLNVPADGCVHASNAISS